MFYAERVTLQMCHARPPLSQPWTHKDHNDACYIVKDANGVAIAYVYYEQDHGRLLIS